MVLYLWFYVALLSYAHLYHHWQHTGSQVHYTLLHYSLFFIIIVAFYVQSWMQWMLLHMQLHEDMHSWTISGYIFL